MKKRGECGIFRERNRMGKWFKEFWKAIGIVGNFGTVWGWLVLIPPVFTAFIAYVKEASILNSLGWFFVVYIFVALFVKLILNLTKNTLIRIVVFLFIGLILLFFSYKSSPRLESKKNKLPLIQQEQKLIPESTKIEKPEIKALKSKLNLLDLFKKNDFNSLLRSLSDWEFGAKDGDKVTIKSQVYFDPVSQTKFLGFYIPNNPKTFEICQSIVGMYKNVLEHNAGIMFETSSPELQPVNSSELNFSGKIFIYHEYHLFDVQKRQLYDLYKSHNLSIQFRGSEYLWEKKKVE